MTLRTTSYGCMVVCLNDDHECGTVVQNLNHDSSYNDDAMYDEFPDGNSV